MYTKDEILKDIFQVEGIHITLDDVPDNAIYITKYSDHYDKQSNGYVGMDVIEERVIDFLMDDLEIRNNMLKRFLIEEKAEIKNSKVSKRNWLVYYIFFNSIITIAALSLVVKSIIH